MKKNPTTNRASSQRARFIETARALEADESEERFNETLKRVAPKRPDDGEPEPI